MVFLWFFMVSYGSRSVFHGFSWFFMVFHGFSWFFMVFHGSRLVFLQNVPIQTVSWPNDPVYVRRPEGGIGPSKSKASMPWVGILFNKQFDDRYQKYAGIMGLILTMKLRCFFLCGGFLIFFYRLWDSWNISVLEISWSTSFVKLREAPRNSVQRKYTPNIYLLGPSQPSDWIVGP